MLAVNRFKFDPHTVNCLVVHVHLEYCVLSVSAGPDWLTATAAWVQIQVMVVFSWLD